MLRLKFYYLNFMSISDTTELRLGNLEEFRAEQANLNRSIADTLHRIELSLNTSLAKACPLPGHCKVIESEIKQKWLGDSARFERLEKRLGEHDSLHREMTEKIDALKALMNRGLGAVAILIVCMPFIVHYVNTYLANKP